VTFDARRPRVQHAAMGVLAALLAIVLVWTGARSRRPFEYMVAGTFATAICLVLVYFFAVKRRFLPGVTFRIARRNAQSS
jgi:hypothetical protein